MLFKIKFGPAIAAIMFSGIVALKSLGSLGHAYGVVGQREKVLECLEK